MSVKQREAWRTPDGARTVRRFLIHFRAAAHKAQSHCVERLPLDETLQSHEQLIYWRSVVRGIDWLLSYVTPGAQDHAARDRAGV